jgi:uncharacterized membrane protein YuzA (DUF378 family)
MAKITLGLSPGRKRWMILNGIIWLIVGNLIAALVARIQGGISIDVVAFYIIFAMIGITPIYHATHSQIEFNQKEIIYVQPVFKILCKWDDFIGLRVSSEGVALRFLNSRIFTLKFIARAIKYLGLWNNTIPLSPYLTLQNRMKVWDVIEKYLEDDQEKKILELLLTG